MSQIKQRVLHFWNGLDTLDERIYFITLFVSIAAALITTVSGIIQQLPPASIFLTAAIFVFVVILTLLSVKFPDQRNAQRIGLVLAINFILFPTIFFASGGLKSGMILFLLVGLFLVSIMLRGRISAVLFILSLLTMELTITLSGRFPQFVAAMTEWQHYQDVKMTLALAGISLYTITRLILSAYDHERARNAVLMEKLRNLSNRDELSGLYNRRELFRRLEVMYGGQSQERTETLSLENHYIAMFDVDNFKHLNDTYGHTFGDEVLSQVAAELQRNADSREGEFAARYGGEEFVCVIRADDANAAFARADQIRGRVAALRFPDKPDLTVTISGGLAACEADKALNQVIRDVDMLLYEAKASGKNRVCIADSKQ